MLHCSTRRAFLGAVGTGLAVAASAPPTEAAEPEPAEPFGYCLNTSTIRGQKLPLVEVIELAARAGFQGLEPWVTELDEYAKGGKSLKDLGQRIRDRGLLVADVIGFAEWVVDDDERRRKGLEEAKRVMGMLQEIGCLQMAAPPAGATNQPGLDLFRAAERYAQLYKIGETMGVTPVMELWGHSRNVRRLSEAVFIAVESGQPNARILPDVFHLYKGGSDPRGVRLLGHTAIGIFHVNDYPAHDRATITDAMRVYPGDGVAPLKELFRDLRAIGYRDMLSLELFNRNYWMQDALTMAKTGLEKMRALVRASATA
jgi:sugar phosphate isomerase/epimerase